MINSQKAIEIFQNTIEKWHFQNGAVENPFMEGNIKYHLFKKNLIDTIQWHKEDEIRRQDISAEVFIKLKRDIDQLNQDRTNTVEKIDDRYVQYYSQYPIQNEARLNSETPAWILDRMSILELKIFHMDEQYQRIDITDSKKNSNKEKLIILLEQRIDLAKCYDELLEERTKGLAYFKLYRQMKMYNDPEMNPSLYQTKNLFR